MAEFNLSTPQLFDAIKRQSYGGGSLIEKKKKSTVYFVVLGVIVAAIAGYSIYLYKRDKKEGG